MKYIYIQIYVYIAELKLIISRNRLMAWGLYGLWPYFSHPGGKMLLMWGVECCSLSDERKKTRDKMRLRINTNGKSKRGYNTVQKKKEMQFVYVGKTLITIKLLGLHDSNNHYIAHSRNIAGSHSHH